MAALFVEVIDLFFLAAALFVEVIDPKGCSSSFHHVTYARALLLQNALFLKTFLKAAGPYFYICHYLFIFKLLYLRELLVLDSTRV